MTTIVPSPRLVRIAAAIALVATLAIPFPTLVAPVLVAAAILIALASADWRGARREIPPSLERIIPDRMVRGRPAPIIYRLKRAAGEPTNVSILDELPRDLGGDLLIEDVRLAPGQALEIARERTPLHRGVRSLGPVFISWRSRMGLFRMRTKSGDGGNISILPPSAAPQHHGGLTHRLLREELGIRPRIARGEGAEFESLREYVPGDDPRHVDWRASARRGRLIVRQHQTERRHTVFIAIDTGRLMAGQIEATTKLDYAIDCAVALARASKEYGDRVGLLAFDRELRAFNRPTPGYGGVAGVVRGTLPLHPFPFEPNYRVLAETLARRQKRRALVVVLTDFVEGSASRELEEYLALLA
ncbi:MAG TPA: DUF58 domain-containing protein, partial [Candidatus Binataceae bacterium]|nr:DUF58 domain-containing protein [Candidatus Binataceae bacterium]